MEGYLIHQDRHGGVYFIWERPGAAPDYPDKEKETKLYGFLLMLESSILECNVSLNIFSKSRQQQYQRLSAPEEIAEERKITESAELRVFGATGISRLVSSDDIPAAMRKVDIERIKIKIESDYPLRSYCRAQMHQSAKSFLYSLADFLRMLDAVFAIDGRDEIDRIKKVMGAKLPDVREIRNSIAHVEDRAMGVRMRRGSPEKIDLQDNVDAPLPGRAMILPTIRDDRLGCTLADGTYREVAVSVETISLMIRALRSIYNCYRWSGSPQPVGPT